MPGFQTQIGEMRASVNRRFYFDPEEDITAFELALVLRSIGPGDGRFPYLSFVELKPGQEIDERIARHFTEQEP